MSEIEILEIAGSQDGIVLAESPWQIPDSAARYLQDIVLDYNGENRRRGPVRAVTSVASVAKDTHGIVQCIDPNGDHHVALLEGDSSNGYLTVLTGADYSGSTRLAWDSGFDATKSYLVHSSQTPDGGVLIGVSERYTKDATRQTLALWRGGVKATYSTGSITLTRGSTAVTGSSTVWSSNVSAGMFVFRGGYPSGEICGVVKTVNSDTSITLEQPSLMTGTGAYAITPLRGLYPNIATGRVTCTTASAVVTGTNTKWMDQLTNAWYLYRLRDLAYIGQVSTIDSQTQVTLSANASVACDEERYIAFRLSNINYGMSTTIDTHRLGFISARYAERQWFANRASGSEVARLWFSDLKDFESVDLNVSDGDYIGVTSHTQRSNFSPIKGLATTHNSLLILKSEETFALYGDTPDTFEVRKIHDDGTLCGMTIVPYEGGAFFAGLEGIYYYDGAEVRNLTEQTLGAYYRTAVSAFDPTSYRAWGMVVQDHYLLFLESVAPPVSTRRGASVTTPTRMTICLNLVDSTISFFTNVDIRGHIRMPAETGKGVWYVVNAGTVATPSTIKGYCCEGKALFEEEALDSLICEGNSRGPRFYVETKRLSAGQQVRKKLWKLFGAHYLSDGDTLSVDIISGMGETGSVASSTLPSSSSYQPKRIKFLSRGHHIGFRIYETTELTATKVRLGAWIAGFKRQRKGRV